MQKSKLLPGECVKELIFEYVDGLYIDITNQYPLSFAEFLAYECIILDDAATFCRIIRNIDKFTEIYEFRCHGGKIRVNYHKRKTL